MTRLLRPALVIARRDYAATVLSRTFLLFLLGPLLPLLFGGMFGAIAARDEPTRPPALAAIAGSQDARLLRAAHARIAMWGSEDRLPPLSIVAPPANPRLLLTDPRLGATAVLSGGLDAPTLTATDTAGVAEDVALLVDQARLLRALGAAAPAPVRLTIRAGMLSPRNGEDARRTFARGAQTGLFVLAIILTGMLISNLVEEKSNKVIEVLAAAVPVDAIFLGKLAGMLAVSLTGIAVWGGLAAGAAALFAPYRALPVPGVGWAAFTILAACYFATLYLLVGAIYLGIGAQAGSVREVQTLSMPLTMVQLLVFGLGSAAVARPDGPLGLLAAVVPWSSPFAMLARAAERPELWPHALALCWQLLWIALVVRASARLFRVTVLKSGRLRLPWRKA